MPHIMLDYVLQRVRACLTLQTISNPKRFRSKQFVCLIANRNVCCALISIKVLQLQMQFESSNIRPLW